MKIDTKNEVHPILVADLAKEEHLARLHKIAARRGAIFVPLLSAPVDRRTHILECYVPGRSSPVMFLAEPVGPPTDRGYPLKLEPYETAATDTEAPHRNGESEPPTLVSVARPPAKVPTSPNISARHTRDLEQPVAAPTPAAETTLDGSSPVASTGSMRSSARAAWAPSTAGVTATSTKK